MTHNLLISKKNVFRFPFKFSAIFLLITFTTTQIISAQEIDALGSASQNIPVRSQEDFQTAQIHQKITPDSFDFLSQTLKLESVNVRDVENSVENREASEPPRLQLRNKETSSRLNDGYEYDRYEFEEAFEQLRPEYATAVILKGLNEDNLKKLAESSFEVGIAIIYGEIVLFTSGNEHEILVNDPVRKILEQASFVAHTHPRGTLEGPSHIDYEEADQGKEFVVTANAVYAYVNNEGERRQTKNTHAEFIAVLNQNLLSPSQVLTRAALNQFISGMDSLNFLSKEEKSTFRSDGSVVFEAESLTIQSSGYWNSGSYILMWGNGEVVAERDFDAGFYEIEVWANGAEGSGALPQLQLRVDGDRSVESPQEIINNGWQWKKYIFTGIEIEEGLHQLSAAYINAGPNRSVSIDRIVVRKTSELAPVRQILEGENMQVHGGRYWNGGNFMMLWANGEVYQDAMITEDGIYEMDVYASGQSQEAELPKMEIKVDGVIYSDTVPVSNNFWTFKKHTISNLELKAGAHRLAVEFFNQAQNRSLSIDRIVLRKVASMPVVHQVIQAESMTTGANYWNGGHYVVLWANDGLSQSLNLPAGEYQIEVHASGVEGGGQNSKLEVRLDGQQIGSPQDVINQRWNFTRYFFDDIKVTAGNHVLLAGLFNPGDGRSLSIEKIIFRKTSEIYPPMIDSPVPAAVNRESVAISGNKLPGGSIWINGVKYQEGPGNRWESPLLLPTAGNHSFEIISKDSAGNIIENRTLSIFRDNIPPTLQFLSAVSVQNSQYLLIYEADGVQHQETLILEEGKNYLIRKAQDAAGNTTTGTLEVVLDSQPPVTEVFQINLNAGETKVRQVELNLTAYDLGSQVTEMAFSNDGVNFSSAEAYARTKSWLLEDGKGSKIVWVKFKDSRGLWSPPVSDTIFYAKPQVLSDFDSIHLLTSWESDGTKIYQKFGVVDGNNAYAHYNYLKKPGFEYSFIALEPQQNGAVNNFSQYQSLRFQFRKTSLTPITLLIKLEFNGSAQVFEQKVVIPANVSSWQEIAVDYSHLSASLTQSVKNILIFADPGEADTAGGFDIDFFQLEGPVTAKGLDDFDGNGNAVQTYWDGDGSAVYQRGISTEQAYDGLTSMKVEFQKQTGMGYSFFALTPKQNGLDNNFSAYQTLRFQVKKGTQPSLNILIRLEFNGSQQSFEQTVFFPEGTDGWHSGVIDFSGIPQNLLQSVSQVLFFAAPSSEDAEGTFWIDQIKLDQLGFEEVLDDFEGNNSRIETYWDGDDAGTVYDRTVESTQTPDGAHAMRVEYDKSVNFPNSHFAITPRQDGFANDFSRFNSLKLLVKKDTAAPMRFMMKFELADTQINFETWREIPAGITGWTEVVFDFSYMDPQALKNVRGVFFMVDPIIFAAAQPSSGVFWIDSLRLSQDPTLQAKQFNSDRPPQLGWIGSSVATDADNDYRTGSLVRINAWEFNAAGDLLDGTIRIVSNSTGYDSGKQKLVFTHDGQFFPYHWDTTGLQAADDYKVVLELRDKSGLVTNVGSQVSPALIVKLTKDVPSSGELLKLNTISIPMPGGSLDFTRSYQPSDAQVYDHQAGLGWHSSLDQFAQEFPDGTVSVSLGNNGYEFYFRNSDGGYRAMSPSNYTILEKLSQGFRLRTREGMIYEMKSAPFIDLNTKLSVTWFISRSIDRNGNMTNFEYDVHRNLTKVITPGGDELRLEYSFRNRDQFNTDKYKLDRLIDPSGRVWSFVYDEDGNLLSETAPDNKTTLYEYDSQSRMTKITSPDGIVQTYEYDIHSRLRKIFRSGVLQMEYIYAGRNIPTFQIKDALGRLTAYTMDDAGNVVRVFNAAGGKDESLYDAKRNLIRKIDALGNAWLYTYDNRGNMLTSTDPLGQQTAYTYDSVFNLVTSMTDPLGNLTQYFYDAKGNLTKTIDPRQNVMEYSYDSKGNLLQMKDGENFVANFQYNLKGLVSSQTNALNFQNLYTYDSRGNLIETKDALNGLRSWEYDIRDRLVSRTDELNREEAFTYDGGGRPSTRQNALNHTVINQTYDSLGRVKDVTDAAGAKTEYTYDAKGNLVQEKNALNQIVEYTYDVLDRLIQIKDALGRITSFEYDFLGQLTKKTDGGNNVTRLEYDSRGLLVKTILPNGGIQQLFYDDAGRLIKEMDALGGSVFYQYDQNSNLIGMTNALGYTTKYGYDKRNLKISETDALSQATQYQYDAVGQLTKVIYPDNTFETVEYDGLGHVTRAVDALGRATGFGYDAVGNLTRVTDSANFNTDFEYDALNRKVKETDAKGNITLLTYDAASRLTQIKDANQNITSFAYDLLGRLTEQKYPDNSTETYGYDAVGNAVQIKDRMGRVTALQYNGLNQLIRKTFPDLTYETFAYNSLGNLIQLTNSTGILSREYDLLGRMTEETDVYGNVLTYTYDAAGHRRTLVAQIGNGTLDREYFYDALGRLKKIYDEEGRGTAYTYDTKNRVTSKLLPNNALTTYSYNAGSDLTSVTHQTASGNVFRSISYVHDSRGLITSKNDSSEGNSTFQYDQLARMISVTHPALGLTIFALDALGSRDSVTQNGTPEDYSANPLNQYEQAGDESFDYNLNGDMIYRFDASNNQHTDYVYNFNDQLVQVWLPAEEMRVAYDAAGRRTLKTLTVAGQTIRFIWDGIELLAETDANGNLIRSYTHGIEVDEVLMQKNHASGETLYFHQDHAMSTVALSDSNGQLKESYTYDAYGNLLTAPVQRSTKFLYTGREYEAELDLYYNRARFYDPKLGRFISSDPKGYEAGLNLYTYALNNPNLFRDPMGTDVYWAGLGYYTPFTFGIPSPGDEEYVEDFFLSLGLMENAMRFNFTDVGDGSAPFDIKGPGADPKPAPAPHPGGSSSGGEGGCHSCGKDTQSGGVQASNYKTEPSLPLQDGWGSVIRKTMGQVLNKIGGKIAAIGNSLNLGYAANRSISPYFNPRLTIQQQETVASLRSLKTGISTVLGGLAGAGIAALTKSIPLAIAAGVAVKTGIDEALDRLENYILSLVGIETDGF